MKKPNSVEEDLENFDESELKQPNHHFKKIWIIASFMILIVIVYYVF
jgi:hypothetical protein